MKCFIQKTEQVSALVSTVCLLLFSLAVAQEAPEFGVFPMSGPDGILVVISGPALHPQTAGANNGWIGYHLYRRGEADAEWLRITTQPISRVGSLEELEAFAGGPIDGLERLLGLNTKQELWERLSNNDSSAMVLGVFSRSFYEAMGLLRWDRQVERGKKYSYRITRVDRNGRESAPCEEMTATFGELPFKLVGPLEPEASNDSSGVVLTWKINPDDSGALSYHVYRAPDLNGTFLRLNRYALVLVADPSSSTVPHGVFVDTTVMQGREYYYAIVSVDYAGNESSRDNLLSLHVQDLTAPPIPQNVFALPSDLGVSLTWDKVDDAAIAGYFVYRSLDPDSLYVKVTESLLPYDTGFYEDRTATATDRLFYRVSAVDLSGNESAPSARALSLYENYVMPLPPQDIQAVRSENGISVSWSRNDEPDLQGYYVFRAESYGGDLTQISPLLGPDTTRYIDTSDYLSARGQYWYLVQAINHTGITSRYSVPVAMSPGGVEQAEAVQGLWGYYDQGSARLFWRAPDDNMVAGYRLYRTGENDTLTWAVLRQQLIERQITEWRDTTVSANQRYFYRICSVNPTGEESGHTQAVKISTFEAVAPAPGGVRVIQSNGVATILWNPSPMADLQGYRVYRRQDNTSSRTLTEQLLPSQTGEYRDQTTVSGQTYLYSISTVDIWGRESERSLEVEFHVQ